MPQSASHLDSIEDIPAELSAKGLAAQQQQSSSRFNKTNSKKSTKHHAKPLAQKHYVKIKPTEINTHFVWALILTISSFFLIGPCWALYKSIQLRGKIRRQELEGAEKISNKIATALLISSIFAAIAWIAILFCSVGLVLAGKLLDSGVV